MDWIVLLEYVATTDDVHIKYFHCRQLPTTADLPSACEVELSSTSQAIQQSIPGADYVSAMNVHIYHSVVPGLARYIRGIWEPGFTGNHKGHCNLHLMLLSKSPYLSSIQFFVTKQISGKQFLYLCFITKTNLICSAVPPDVALVMAHAASFLVLNSALLRISTNIGIILASITDCV